MSDLKQLDAESRLRALEIESFIVEAPAGAGKTELLTQRYLKLLSTVNEPEEIIALTFTNKAAAEMRNRILQSLLDCTNHTEITQAHKQQTRTLAEAALKQAEANGWQLLTQPSRLRILTMDALCSSLARQMPLLSRLGGQPMVSEDSSIHYAEAAQLALAEVAGESSLQAPISAVLGFMNNDIEKLSKLLAEMLAKREQWLLLAGQHTQFNADEISAQCLAVIESCAQEKLTAALRALPASVQSMLMPVARFAASNLGENHILRDWNMPLEANINQLPSWLALRQLLLTDGSFRKPSGLNVKFGFPKHPERDTHIQTFSDVCELIGEPSTLDALGELPIVTEIDLHANSAIVQAFAQLLQRAAAHLWTVFQSVNEVDFVAIAQSAIRALENEQGATDLALKLDYKISHLLVDEFQDTNATQLALLQQLTQGWEPHDGRTLFCVGDPMQSIYRFRKADVSLFLQAAENGIGHIPLKSLKLTLNNRSQPKVVEWINQTFRTIFPAEDNEIEAAIQYRDFIATKAMINDEGVETHALVVDGDEESENTRVLEAHYVADLITKEQADTPQQKIAVLVRSRKHLRELVSEIRRNYTQLKFQAVEIEELNHRQTVQDALSLTRALLHRADRVHWLNVLRAPLCGLTLADLHTLCADDHQATIWQLMHEKTLSANVQARLNHVKNVFTEAFNQQGRMPLRRWLESTWLKLGGANTLINAGDNRDVQAFFDLVEKLSVGYSLDFEQLEEGMQKLYAEPDIAANDTLQFLTIHKSKGLEFDCVILPALNRKPRHPDSPLMLWEEVQIDGKLQLLAAPYAKKKNGAKQISPSIYDYIKSLETRRENNETTRLLYVAATRTMRKLHLVATAKRKNETISPVKNSFLELLWPKLSGDFSSAKTSSLEADSNQTLAQFTPQLMRLPQAGIPLALSAIAHTPAKTSLPQTASPESALNLAADCGTLAHLYMELIANTGLGQWPESRINTCLPAMVFWLQQRGHAAGTATHATAEVANALLTTIKSDDGKWVLQTRPDEVNEYAIDFVDNNTVAKKVIDRTFTEAGVRWIIDYKTTIVANNFSSAELKLLAEPFRGQLEAYANLFINEGLNVKCAIFFIHIGRLVIL
jgi:ATP-dependent helicase/nuclease subunit A